jgi:hypothetical protein
MAKKSKARKNTVPSLKPALTQSLKAAKALRGKVAERRDLDALIKGLTDLQARAAKGCGATTWGRTFTLAKATAKSTKRSTKKR